MDRENRFTYYRNIAEEQQKKIQAFTKQIYLVGTLRLVVFVSASVCIYLLRNNLLFSGVVFLIAAIVFAFLLKKYDFLNHSKRYASTLKEIAENEEKALCYNYSAFDGASERINPSHDFSFDLDVFGEKSIFQLINRSALKIGKEQLYTFLENPLYDKSEIEKRQIAVKELADDPSFCLSFRTIGGLTDDLFETRTDAKKTFSIHSLFKHSAIWKTLIILVPIIYVIYIFLIATGLFSTDYFVLLYLLTVGLSTVPMKKIKRIWTTFDKKTKILKQYAQLFRLIENTSFKSDLLTDIQKDIIREAQASKSIQKLSAYSRNLDQGFAFPILLLLNPLFLWNIKYALKIEDWMKQNRYYIHQWFSALAQIDALISLGTFTFNNPDFIFPEVSTRTFCFEATQLGHPLIPREKCVKNNVHISETPYFMIITGANMAGKSTYLRAVGVNHLLASVGAPVYAQRFVFAPCKLLTNLRTADSLVNNESYFFAELKRLKMIVERLKSNENKLFIILDEILKGTNSEDKQKGSFALMKRFIKLNGNGIIATHDLALGALETEFPQAIKNYNFDADISNDTLSFTYQIHEGVARNMNASFLMKTMDIVE